MDLSAIKKILFGHRIVILEGFWGSGKSTIAHFIRDQTGGIIVPEPVYPDRNMRDSDISAWYIACHESRWKKAWYIMRRGNRKVVCERSVLSSAAFEYASKGYLSEVMEHRVRNFLSHQSTAIVYLKPTRTLITRGIARLRDASVLRQWCHRPRFVSAYHKFFYRVLPHDFNMRNLYYLHTSIRLLAHLRKRVYEVSAASVVIRGNKVVVLYDKERKHFVLPQGHGEVGESFIQTARRETVEETGYTDLMYVKKLYSYQYHFLRTYQTVYKSIHVYLFKLETTRRKAQILEAHEMYEACLIPIRRAIAILHWPQDRLVMKKAMLEIKKGPRPVN